MGELKITYGNITDKNIEMLVKINKATLPVHYTRAFYKKVVENYTKHSKYGKPFLHKI